MFVIFQEGEVFCLDAAICRVANSYLRLVARDSLETKCVVNGAHLLETLRGKAIGRL